jgi:hypothetical protein
VFCSVQRREEFGLQGGGVGRWESCRLMGEPEVQMLIGVHGHASDVVAANGAPCSGVVAILAVLHALCGRQRGHAKETLAPVSPSCDDDVHGRRSLRRSGSLGSLGAPGERLRSSDRTVVALSCRGLLEDTVLSPFRTLLI